MAPIRVVLAEEGDLLRAGVLAPLVGFDDIDVVVTATTLPEPLAAVDEHLPDELRHTHPGIGVVALTQYSDVEYALDLVRDGSNGHGYLLKKRVADVDEHVSRAWLDAFLVDAVLGSTGVAALAELRRDDALNDLSWVNAVVVAAGGGTLRLTTAPGRGTTLRGDFLPLDAVG